MGFSLIMVKVWVRLEPMVIRTNVYIVDKEELSLNLLWEQVVQVSAHRWWCSNSNCSNNFIHMRKDLNLQIINLQHKFQGFSNQFFNQLETPMRNPNHLRLLLEFSGLRTLSLWILLKRCQYNRTYSYPLNNHTELNKCRLINQHIPLNNL